MYDPNYMTIWKGQPMDTVVGRVRQEDGKMNRQCTEELYGCTNTLYGVTWWIHVIIHVSKPTECTTPRVNSKVNYGL